MICIYVKIGSSYGPYHQPNTKIMSTLDISRPATASERTATAPPSAASAKAAAALEVLLSRQSHWPLTEPGPASTELDLIFDAALRAPDHGNLRPWRFVTIRGDARGQLGLSQRVDRVADGLGALELGVDLGLGHRLVVFHTHQ